MCILKYDNSNSLGNFASPNDFIKHTWIGLALFISTKYHDCAHSNKAECTGFIKQ